jgi:putative transposase
MLTWRTKKRKRSAGDIPFVWQIHYHIVFPVKYRKLLVDKEVIKIIVETAEEIQERFSIEMGAIGCDKNHIDLLCSAHPKMAPGQIVQIFKSIPAREIFHRKPVVKKKHWGGEFWTDGYYVGTIGEHGNWDTVEQHVKRQSIDPKDLRKLKFFDF